ncbi:MAG: ROK family protein [Clostridia bacterium]|nr:ROK family protein [Clostridia bacterium]
MYTNRYCIGVDLGGTNIAVGLVRLDTKNIVKQFSVKTNAPRSCESISEDIAEVSKKLCSQEGIKLSDVEWIGIATPGIVKDDVVLVAFNLGWTNAEFGKILSNITGRPTYVANDANAAAYAEAIWGSGQGAKSLIAFTLGTGVGGGIVIDGKIWEGMNGFAAEMGHTILVPGGRSCSCGKRGCIEAYCSATALIKETKRMMKNYPESLMWKEVNGDIERVSGKTAFRGKDEGDRCAELVVNEFVDSLAVGIENAINMFQPDVVCIGGGISREGENLLAPLRERVLHGTFGIDGRRTKLVAAHFRNDAGIIGAALLGLQYEIKK